MDRLSQLSCDAALELDNRIIGNGDERAATAALAEWLREASDAMEGDEADPTAIVLLHRVVQTRFELAEILPSTVAELAVVIRTLAKRFRDVVTGDVGPKELAVLRDVSVELSRRSMTSEWSRLAAV